MAFEVSIHGWTARYVADDLLYQVVSPMGVIVNHFPRMAMALHFIETNWGNRNGPDEATESN